VVLEAHRSDNAEAKEREDAGDPAQKRIHAVDGHINGPRERFAPCSVLANKPARSQSLQWAEGFPADQCACECLRIAGSVSDSYLGRGHRVPHALHSYTGDILTASGIHEVYPFGGEAQPFSVVPRSRVWEYGAHCKDTLHTWIHWIQLMVA
jgi:hypothetical protein